MKIENTRVVMDPETYDPVLEGVFRIPLETVVVLNSMNRTQAIEIFGGEFIDRLRGMKL